jgi:hypothetical protein
VKGADTLGLLAPAGLLRLGVPGHGLVRRLGLIVAGHGDLTGLGPRRLLGRAAQGRAYRIAGNATADLATWDLALLPGELAELQQLEVDLSLLGFGEDELAKLLEPGVKHGLTDPDEIPEPPDEAITQSGELWVLGEHRLLCGDGGRAADVPIVFACRTHRPRAGPPKPATEG